MARTAHAVIGSAWGDEGKGLMTDYLSDENTLVVRFNGGAQAGHTVVTPDDQRHVFHHVGSGSFRGADTLLSRHFICNPLLLRKELAELSVKPTIYVDWRARVTTPWDMAINQLVERHRGEGAHGSCGMGINETVTRCENPAFRTRVIDFTEDGIHARLEAIQKAWVPTRLRALGVEADEFSDLLHDADTIDRFIEDCGEFLGAVLMRQDASEILAANKVVFEGAQGLLLDEHNRQFFPHVTRSRTGLVNALQLASEAFLQELEVVYVTRPYSTRHGAGPFPQHVPGLTFADDTNDPNPWQGTMRFGLLDLKILRDTIWADLRNVGEPLRIRPVLAVTHLDQVDCSDLRVSDIQAAALLEARYISRGPTRLHVSMSEALTAAG